MGAMLRKICNCICCGDNNGYKKPEEYLIEECLYCKARVEKDGRCARGHNGIMCGICMENKYPSLLQFGRCPREKQHGLNIDI